MPIVLKNNLSFSYMCKAFAEDVYGLRQAYTVLFRNIHSMSPSVGCSGPTVRFECIPEGIGMGWGQNGLNEEPSGAGGVAYALFFAEIGFKFVSEETFRDTPGTGIRGIAGVLRRVPDGVSRFPLEYELNDERYVCKEQLVFHPL